MVYVREFLHPCFEDHLLILKQLPGNYALNLVLLRFRQVMHHLPDYLGVVERDLHLDLVSEALFPAVENGGNLVGYADDVFAGALLHRYGYAFPAVDARVARAVLEGVAYDGDVGQVDRPAFYGRDDEGVDLAGRDELARHAHGELRIRRVAAADNRQPGDQQHA